jgi:hypothetical protein
MRRREFITLISGAAALPVVARAQRPEQIRRIGVLTQGSINSHPTPPFRARVFTQPGANADIVSQWAFLNFRRVPFQSSTLPARMQAFP